VPDPGSLGGTGHRWAASTCALLVTFLLAAPAVAGLDPPAWTKPIAPFHLIVPIDYVRTEGLAAYLIRTRAGAILIDGTLEENAPLIRRNVEAMGVPIGQVKLLLLTHAHFYHAGGLAALKAASGAKLVAGARDRRALESGRPEGETSYPAVPFPAVKVDRGVGEGGVVSLGEVRITAHATPGHTPDCTSWTMTVRDAGRPVRVIFPCSITVAGNRLIGNRSYPAIVSDFRLSLGRLAALKAMSCCRRILRWQMYERARTGRLVGPTLLPAFVSRAQKAFETELDKQRSQTHRPRTRPAHLETNGVPAHLEKDRGSPAREAR
jgi:hypothetical protein